MKITQNYLTNNDCYKKAQLIPIKGIMLHSTACPRCSSKEFSQILECIKTKWKKRLRTRIH